MPASRQWVFTPDRGGVRIPEAVKRRTTERIQRFAETHFAGRYTRFDIRFRGQFCYIDAYKEPEPLGPNWPPPDWPETREEFIERLRATPTHLCRLRYFGDEERWGFAFYAYSSDSYKLSVFPSGDFFGPPEDAFFSRSVSELIEAAWLLHSWCQKTGYGRIRKRSAATSWRTRRLRH